MKWIAKIIILSTSLLAPTYLSASVNYKITGVKNWDTLNMRSQAGVKSKVVAKIPANGSGIKLTGKENKIGRTVWRQIQWQGKTGWVNKNYLAIATPQTPTKPQPQATKKPIPPTKAKNIKADKPKVVLRNKKSGMWILECGSASPFWKVEVLPEWMKTYQGNRKSGVPLQHKKQVRTKWNNTAIRTDIRGKRGKESVDLTLRYTKQCMSSLAKRKVSFSVSGSLNGKKVSGCCRSYQVK